MWMRSVSTDHARLRGIGCVVSGGSVSAPEIVALSLRLEAETGYDSIPTIEGMYSNECIFPGCETRTKDAEKMWLHVHFGRKHGLSFGKTLDELLEESHE